jgi:ribosomal protein S18 acetylase RimI-like enzyme
MLQELLQQARERFPAVSLSVSKANPAVRLYARTGFEIIAESVVSYTMLLRFSRSTSSPS